MKRRLFGLALSLAAAICMTFGLVGCDFEESKPSEDLWSMERVYAKAQELGFEGTLEELIAMFKGDKGEDGAPGKDGVDGKDGAPGKDGVDGKDGAPGKDGVDGKDGAPGKDGVDGKDGAPGKDGVDGKDGAPGKDGVDGKDGAPGKDGIGIESMEVDENGHLIVTYTDGTQTDLGKITADETLQEEGTEGLQFQKRKDADGKEYAAVVGLGTAWETDIVIPSSYRGLSVKQIGDYAFSASLDPRTASLTSISIPESVTEIGNNAFDRCAGLETVTLKQNSKLTSIGMGAFSSCGLQNIAIPNSVTMIEMSAFSYCNSLQSVSFGNDCKLTSIGMETFLSCGLQNIAIPNSVTMIEMSAFSYCNSLQSVSFGDDSKLTSIGMEAFRECESLRSITIPEHVTEIEDSAFYGCRLLTKVTIPSSLKSIGQGAFSECVGLAEVWNYSDLTIRKGDTEFGRIGEFAFQIYNSDAESKQTETDDGYLFYEGDEGSYMLGYAGVDVELTLPSLSPKGRKYIINMYAFRNKFCFSVTIPNGVVEIGNRAFDSCIWLTQVSISDEVKTIGISAFFGCRRLQSVSFGTESKLTSIERSAFEGCGSLQSITIPKNVISIGRYAFRSCEALQRVHFETPNGWYFSATGDISDLGEPIDGLKDDEFAASRLREALYYWMRVE